MSASVIYIATVSQLCLQQRIIGRAGASPPSRTAAIIFLYIIFIYLYPCRTSYPQSSMCIFFSDFSIFLRRMGGLH